MFRSVPVIFPSAHRTSPVVEDLQLMNIKAYFFIRYCSHVSSLITNARPVFCLSFAPPPLEAYRIYGNDKSGYHCFIASTISRGERRAQQGYLEKALCRNAVKKLRTEFTMRPRALTARRLRLLKSASLKRCRHLLGSPRGAGPVQDLCEKIIQNRGSRGHAPLGCLPLWGREGVTLANSTSGLFR